jgi:cellobiose PTS system EIIC component
MLPWSFVGLVVGLASFILAQPSGTFLQRLYVSFAPAFGVMSFLLVLLLTADVARRRAVPPPLAVATAFIAFVLSLPHAEHHGAFALLRSLGSAGLFLAMLTAFVSVGALRFFRGRFGPLYGSLAGCGLVACTAALLYARGFSLAALLTTLLAPLGHLGDSLVALVVLTAVETLLWTIGIHGPALLAAIVLPVYLGLQAQNTEALAHGQPLPHIVTVSLFLFVFPGGAGATLPLVLLLLRSRVRRVRTVAYAALVPAFFNVNEPLMFGLPLVLDPILATPFVLAPTTLAVVTYAVVSAGWVARPALYVPSSVPAFVNVFIATHDWRACVLVAFNLIVALVLYAPFVAAFERRERARAGVGA